MKNDTEKENPKVVELRDRSSQTGINVLPWNSILSETDIEKIETKVNRQWQIYLTTKRRSKHRRKEN